MAPDLIGLALGLLLGAPPCGLPLAPDHAFHPRERAVGDWRWQAAAHLGASPGTRANVLPGRDPAAVTRCVRLNNDRCIKRGGWSGEIAADGDGNVAFASAAEGATVAALPLRRYDVDDGRRSAMAIVSRWAPASCGAAPLRALPRLGRPDGLIRFPADPFGPPLIPAQAGTQRPKTAEGRQDHRPVPSSVAVDDEAGLRPDILRWIPACAGMSGFQGRRTDHTATV